MPRLRTLLVLLSLFAGLLLALPTFPHAGPKPHAVVPLLRTLTVTPAALTTSTYQEIGATWRNGTLASGDVVEVRTRSAGSWSPWQQLPSGDASPDTGSKDAIAAARRGTTSSDPLWVGVSDGVQTRVVTAQGRIQRMPTSLRLVTINPGTSAADAGPTATSTAGDTAEASEIAPKIYSRAQWGADESLRGYNGKSCTTPDYSSTIKVGFVHHTDGGNSYTPAQVPAIIRGIYAYHVKTKGWCDIGYNFLVDRFGRVWEGRYGGITKAVIGAHTGGFNRDSFGAALMGTFQTATPPAVMLTALEKLFAWKLQQYYLDPMGTNVLTSQGGGTAKFAAGVSHRFSIISGHRDAGNTDCPGQRVYNDLPSIRTAVKADIQAGLVAPTVSAGTSTTGPVVSAHVLKRQSWTVTVIRTCDSAVISTQSGTATTSFSVQVPRPRAGAYTVRITSAAGSNQAIPYGTPITITSTVPVPAAQKGTGTQPLPAGFVSMTPTRVLDTRTGTGRTNSLAQPLGPGERQDVQVTGVGTIPVTGVSAVAVNLSGTCVTAATTLTAYPADSARPTTTSLSLPANTHRSGLVQVGLSPTGALSIYNASGYADVVADVVGYFPTGGLTSSTYHPLTATRLADTRNSPTTSTTVVVGNSIPVTATAAVVSVTAASPKTESSLSAYPTGSVRPYAASFTAAPGRSTTELVVVGLDADSFTVNSTVATGLTVDLVGWYGPGASGSSYQAVRPIREVDTTKGLGITKGMLASGSIHTITLTGIPSTATAVAMTATNENASAPGTLEFWAGGARPTSTDLNFVAGSASSDLVLVPVTAGTIQVFSAGGKTDLTGDVLGYYT